MTDCRLVVPSRIIYAHASPFILHLFVELNNPARLTDIVYSIPRDSRFHPKYGRRLGSTGCGNSAAICSIYSCVYALKSTRKVRSIFTAVVSITDLGGWLTRLTIRVAFTYGRTHIE
jgi:hypothetical protein